MSPSKCMTLRLVAAVYLSVLFCPLHEVSSAPISKACGPGKKDDNKGNQTCISIDNNDVSHSLNWMAHPPSSICNKITTVQGIDVCEDNMPKNCQISSLITSLYCDDMGSLDFEKYWSKQCDVVIYHFYSGFKGNICGRQEGKAFPLYPRLSIVRNDMWAKRCYNCLYKHIEAPADNQPIFVLKIQQRGDFEDDFDGVQYTVLSDLFLHKPELSKIIQQVVMIASYTPLTLVDK